MGELGSYLTFFPQYCREEINDSAWYPGYTDWDLIRGLPVDRQSRFRPERGFYDLSVREVIAEQLWEIAHGSWSGMALYHYFFDGRFALPAVERFIAAGGGPVPAFFLIWANESWTKRWIGKPREIIVRQHHRLDAAVVDAHTEHLCGLMRHERYVRIDGRPLFVIYAPYEIADVARFVDVYRRSFRRRGENPVLGFCCSYVDVRFAAANFDLCVEFQPRLFFNVMRGESQRYVTRLGMALKRALPAVYELATAFRDQLSRRNQAARAAFDYGDYLALAEQDYFARLLGEAYKRPVMRCAFYSWNNYPRYRGSSIVVNHRKGEFARFTSLCQSMSERGRQYLLNSWNEWSEGAALQKGIEPASTYDLVDR